MTYLARAISQHGLEFTVFFIYLVDFEIMTKQVNMGMMQRTFFWRKNGPKSPHYDENTCEVVVLADNNRFQELAKIHIEGILKCSTFFYDFSTQIWPSPLQMITNPLTSQIF
jgi:hypothetical protein